MHTVAADDVLKNTFANFAFEHFEIASYNSLFALTEAAGETSGTTAPKQPLS